MGTWDFRSVPRFRPRRRSLARQMLLTRGIAIGAPRRHRALPGSLNAAVRVNAGGQCEFSRTSFVPVPFAGVEGTHDATVCTIFSSSASTASGAAIERQLAPWPQWNQAVAKKAIAELWAGRK